MHKVSTLNEVFFWLWWQFFCETTLILHSYPSHKNQNLLSQEQSVESFSKARNSFVAQMQPYDSTGNSLHGPLRGREGTWKKNLLIKMATL